MADLPLCSVQGCGNRVQKPGYPLCRSHWMESRKKVEETSAPYVVGAKHDDSSSANNALLNSTALGAEFGLDAKQINRVLFDLGWTEKDGKGWKPSVLGEKLKAKSDKHTRSGVHFVLWHRDICKSRILQNAISEFKAIEMGASVVEKTPELTEEAADKTEGFREKFPPTIRASDGHMVRSRAEAMIDAWFYENRIVHAYERLVRTEEKMYCDFYLPELDLYIEFWGLEGDPRYKARKEKKLDIYRQNELRLIEIKDRDIDNLDDYLMGQLVKFGYKAK